MEVNGPDETRIVTAEPFAARPDGVVPTTVPFAMALLCTDDTLATLKPSMVSAVLAWLTEALVTTGIDAYRPEVSHQPPIPSPTPSATISATIASRGLNSQRCRNGSRPPEYRPPSSRCTTRVREPPPSWPGSSGPVPGPFAGGAGASCPHHPLVAAGVSRLSHGASVRPWTPTPITPVSPLGSPTLSLTRRTARANSPASAGRSAGSRLVAASTSWSTAAGIPGTSAEGAGTSWLTCW